MNEDLATKDFDCTLDHYYLFEGQLYRHGGREPLGEPTLRLDGDELELTRSERAGKVDLTGPVGCYTHCEACEPIVFEREDSDRVDHRHVWCEWTLAFDHGKLSKVDPVRLETRDLLRQKMQRDGVGVLPDDDRISKKHIKQLRDGRRRGFW